ncbi:MAG: GLUG motif-containing protein [Candidatus Thermoplasmatota archaeon]
MLVGTVSAAGGSFGGGNGTVGNPYIIEDVLDLQNMSANLSAHYALGNDIDASATESWGVTYQSLVAQWKMNESSWTGAAGEVVDSSTYGHNATAYNGAQTTTGKYGRAGLFDGVDDYVSYPDDPDLDLVGDFTVCAWMNATAFTWLAGLVSKYQTAGTNGFTLRMNVAAPYDRINFCEFASPTKLALGTWYHVAGVMDDGVARIYINGSLDSSGSPGYTPAANADALRIGSDFSARYFNGMIDDVRLYKIALNASEVANIASSEDYQHVGYEGFAPVGNLTSQFNGSLDGRGHTIFNLTINRPAEDYVGLFCYIGTPGFVSNVFLGNVDVSGRDWTGALIGLSYGDTGFSHSTGIVSGDDWVGGLIGRNYGNLTDCSVDAAVSGYSRVGGLVGESNGPYVNNSFSTGTVTGAGGNYVGGLLGYNTGKIDNCYSTGTVTGAGGNYVGGLLGYNTGEIDNCYSTGTVTGAGGNYIGGLVGQNNGIITNCSSTGDASGSIYVGGLVGWNDGGTITNCYSTGDASGTGDRVGGLVGESTGTVTNCYSTGNASGTWDRVGGLFGYNNGDIITDCSSTGNASGRYYVGGLVGYNSGAIIMDCYSTGNASGTSNVGGLIGHNYGGITNCYSTGNASGTGDYVGGLIGYNNGDIITDCSSTGNASGTSNVGGLVGWNDGGTITDCYSTGNASGGNMFVGGLVGYNTGTVTNCYSTGNASGTSCVGGLVGYNTGTITDCYSTGNASGDYEVGGLVGYNEATITNCYSTGDASGTWDRVGGLVGYNRAPITDCYSTGDASGTSNVGGLVGENDGSITNCYSTGDTSGTSNVGGLVGHNRFGTIITNCYGRGNANGTSNVGGLVGYNEVTITNCYSTGTASGTSLVGGFAGNNTGTITDCFWDNETSGWTTSDGGTGKNTTEMKTKSTFTAAGWDFTNIWDIRHTHTYPFFRWEDRDYPPMANDDDYTALEDGILGVTAPGVLGNDDEWEGEPLSVTAFDDPSVRGAAVSVSPDGSFTYDPTGVPALQALAVGEYLVDTFTYTVSDGKGGMDTATVSVNVTGANDAPEITTANVIEAVEGAAYSVDYGAADADASDVLTWSLSSNATGLTINAGSGLLGGTPSAAGTFYVNVSVDDGSGGLDWTNFTLTVLADTDGDGIPDTQDDDDDGDGWSDAIEIIGGFDPLDNASVPGDADLDGIADYMDPDFLTTIQYNNQTVNQTVWQNSTNNVTIGVSDADSDGDGWNDAIEIAGGTDPLDPTDEPADTDGDGIADFMDVPEPQTNTVVETPIWAWGALIAAIVLGILAALGFMRGRKSDKINEGDAPEAEEGGSEEEK